MSRKPPIPRCSEEERKILEGWVHSGTLEVCLVDRAKIIIGCLGKRSVNQIA